MNQDEDVPLIRATYFKNAVIPEEKKKCLNDVKWRGGGRLPC